MTEVIPFVIIAFIAVFLIALRVYPQQSVQTALSREARFSKRQSEAIDGSSTSSKVAEYGKELGAKELFEIENESRRTVAQTFGGVAVLGGLLFTWFQLIGVEEGRITDRYTKAIDQLEATNSIEVRLGGIFALERIALDSQRDRETIREILAHFVRTNACWTGNPHGYPCPAEDSTGARQSLSSAGTIGMRDGEPNPPRADVVAAVQVISSLSNEDTWPQPCLDLSNTDLALIYLVDSTFSNVCFNGANLEGAKFKGATLQHVRFVGANLEGSLFDNTVLTDTVFSGATLYLASFLGADFEMVNLKRAGLVDKFSPERIALGLTTDQLRGACLDERTDLPNYITAEEVNRRGSTAYCAQ